MARKVSRLTSCMVTQDLLVDHWDWTDADEIKAIKDNDAIAVGQIIIDKLEAAGIKVAESYIVKHDKDVHKKWDEVAGEYVVEYKTNHVHNVLKFADGGAELTKIAAAVGLKPEYVQKPKRGRYSYDNMIAYLCHIKYPDKYQYEPEEIHTYRGRSYVEIYHERKTDWIKARAKMQQQSYRCDVDWLVDKIVKGEITKTQIHLTDEYYMIYSANMRRCDDAFRAYGERKAYKAAKMLKDGDFKLSVFFFYGLPGTGKTKITDRATDKLLEYANNVLNERWEVYNAATSNPMDDYAGQEIIVLDDLRGIAMDATDWLLLLDPYRANPAGARYHNKQQVASRVVIMTASIDPYTYFYYTKNKGAVNEALDQFIRRIEACVQIYMVDANGNIVSDTNKIGQMMDDRGNVTTGQKLYACMVPKQGEAETHIIRDDSVKESPYRTEPVVQTRYNLKTVNVCDNENDVVNTIVDVVARNHMSANLKQRGITIC